MKLIVSIFFSILLFLITACTRINPNLDKSGSDEIKSHEVKHFASESELTYNEIIYVPIYSDIYIDPINQNSLLAATLSIRNTSYKDTLFISKIDYFNTEGQLVRSYLENLISLSPMATLNYVIEPEDDTGGPGANFIVEINSTNKKIKPIIQAVMVGQNGNKGFSFVTNGYSIK